MHKRINWFIFQRSEKYFWGAKKVPKRNKSFSRWEIGTDNDTTFVTDVRMRRNKLLTCLATTLLKWPQWLKIDEKVSFYVVTNQTSKINFDCYQNFFAPLWNFANLFNCQVLLNNLLSNDSFKDQKSVFKVEKSFENSKNLKCSSFDFVLIFGIKIQMRYFWWVFKHRAFAKLSQKWTLQQHSNVWNEDGKNSHSVPASLIGIVNLIKELCYLGGRPICFTHTRTWIKQ